MSPVDTASWKDAASVPLVSSTGVVAHNGNHLLHKCCVGDDGSDTIVEPVFLPLQLPQHSVDRRHADDIIFPWFERHGDKDGVKRFAKLSVLDSCGGSRSCRRRCRHHLCCDSSARDRCSISSSMRKFQILTRSQLSKQADRMRSRKGRQQEEWRRRATLMPRQLRDCPPGDGRFGAETAVNACRTELPQHDMDVEFRLPAAVAPPVQQGQQIAAFAGPPTCVRKVNAAVENEAHAALSACFHYAAQSLHATER